MNLRNVLRINYKFIHDGKEIPMNDEEDMIFLHLNDKNDIEEDLIDEYEAEYIFLTEQMNWQKIKNSSKRNVRQPSPRSYNKSMTWKASNQNTGMN